MAQKPRQNKLFAAEDFSTIYESFINADLKSYDFDTVRTAMVDYVRKTYPESYSDWVESSEFVSILDIVAQFAHNLSFRIDLNSRNNFLSTAERQEAVLKLADFLGYRPVRNRSANGLLKVSSVRTTQPVVGSDGTNLGAQDFRFEDGTGVDNYLAVINSLFAQSNKYGSPKKQVIEDNVTTQWYDVNNTSEQVKFTTSGVANGNNTQFDIVSAGFDTTSDKLIEAEPNPYGAFTIVYRNDGRGVTSENTGFFVKFAQGSLQFTDTVINSTVSGQTIDINVNNINEEDVYVQTVDEAGRILKSWSRVDNTYGHNEVYNALRNNTRDIYKVYTRDNNQITVKFADSAFGNQPQGIVRVWYRVSLNDTYVLRPADIDANRISISYVGDDNITYTAQLGVELKSTVTTAQSAETVEDIKTKAPRAYASQNRMITSDDYSNFIYTKSQAITKIKSIARTHSGHSRYQETQDPTGAYSNLIVYGTDGNLHRGDNVKTLTVSRTNPETVLEYYLKPILNDSEFVNLYYDRFSTAFSALKTDTTVYSINRVSTTSVFLTSDVNPGVVQRTGDAASGYLSYVRVGAMIRFKNPGALEYVWARVTNISNHGMGIDNSIGTATGRTVTGQGAITLDATVPDGYNIDVIYPAFTRLFDGPTKTTLESFLRNRQDFSIKYDYITRTWDVDDRLNNQQVSAQSPAIADPVNQAFPGDFTRDDPDSWLIYVDYNASVDRYTINYRTSRYTFTSNNTVFSNISNEYVLDEQSRKKNRDTVDIIDTATNVKYNWFVAGYALDNNKQTDYNKILLSIVDVNNDDRPDAPDIYNSMASAFDITNSDLRFEWTHKPDTNQIIDPSFTNIIDVFCLTTDYDVNYRQWLTDTTGNVEQPFPPTTAELKQLFYNLDDYKAMSDRVIYRPARYRTIFGEKSNTQDKAKFQVVRIPGTNITDSEIRNRIVEAINEYFALANWDFGENFYFTELSAYIHNQLVGYISSVVIVPVDAESEFGSLFQISTRTDEILIPDIGVDNIDIVDSADNLGNN